MGFGRWGGRKRRKAVFMGWFGGGRVTDPPLRHGSVEGATRSARAVLGLRFQKGRNLVGLFG
jgi:hypothetical protein